MIKRKPDTTPVQPTIDPATANAVIASVCGGLRPFLALGREIMKRDYPKSFEAATVAVAANRAVEVITIMVRPRGVVVTLALCDPASQPPEPLFSLTGITGEPPFESLPYAVLN